MDSKMIDPIKYDLHDNKIHGISLIAEVENFKSELRLDIDHIIQWPDCTMVNRDDMRFVVSRAILTFPDLVDLVIDIKCLSENGRKSSPYVFIDRLECKRIERAENEPERYFWEIFMTDARSTISFAASIPNMRLVGNNISTKEQYLTEEERS